MAEQLLLNPDPFPGIYVNVRSSSALEYVAPKEIHTIRGGDRVLEFGSYIYHFKSFHLVGERLVRGEEMIRRARCINAWCGFQHALWMLKEQALIPVSMRGNKRFVFAGVEASVGLYNDTYFPLIRWNGKEWVLEWDGVGFIFDQNYLLVSARENYGE